MYKKNVNKHNETGSKSIKKAKKDILNCKRVQVRYNCYELLYASKWMSVTFIKQKIREISRKNTPVVESLVHFFYCIDKNTPKNKRLHATSPHKMKADYIIKDLENRKQIK